MKFDRWPQRILLHSLFTISLPVFNSAANGALVCRTKRSQRVLRGPRTQACNFGVAETMEGELRHKLFGAAAGQNEMIRSLRRAQVRRVQRSIGVQNLAEANAHVGSRLS